ncbi:conserved hypothetical protein [Methanocaldococcus vulcanius M7]|uniref:DUF1894 domain-containing protein n=1 Tax=Methanocaldococcus vulcanius (strain ATCC 700851 / DSM 12094 / M7) TaxID=579137 RepID=C9RE54_METVM|nr:DUF1894 domain-containing protein [Methanocaldococcus vulcanius]ACX73583.1 conserved hypothetical protein [Methanocaldococcus vulcanius M7]
MGCVDKLNYEILYKGGFKDCAEFIRKNFKNIKEKEAGCEIFEGIFLIGIPPIPVAYEENCIIFPYTKPCYGTFVLKVNLSENEKEKEKMGEDKNKKSFLSKLRFW